MGTHPSVLCGTELVQSRYAGSHCLIWPTEMRRTLSGGLASVSSPQAGAPVDAQITWMKTHLWFLRSVGKYRLLIDPRGVALTSLEV